jgi:hypothetical protein
VAVVHTAILVLAQTAALAAVAVALQLEMVELGTRQTLAQAKEAMVASAAQAVSAALVAVAAQRQRALLLGRIPEPMVATAPRRPFQDRL